MFGQSLFSIPAAAKKKLDIAIKWNEPIDKSHQTFLISTHINTLLDTYKNFSDDELNIPPEYRKDRKTWLKRGIDYYLPKLEQGLLQHAVIYVCEQKVGFMICDPNQPRNRNNFDYELEVLLLAIKPFKYKFLDLFDRYPQWLKNKDNLPENIRIGLGGLLMAEVEKKFPHANQIKLDTRAINTGARKFYEQLGFVLTTQTIPNFVYYQKNLTPQLRAC